ncbi:MAG: hypothetical protein ACE5DL_01650 [Nitrosopumilaceae archaeon]
MKTRIAIPLIATIVAVILIIGISSEIQFDQKYQYRFGETTIVNEKDQQFDRVFFSYSHDFGTTFSESQDVSMSENTWTGEPKMILMNEDVILVWREEIFPLHTLSFAISDNFGKTLEKKYLWFGSRPDIIHYDNVLYLTWVDLETRQVLYTTTDNKGETFAEHKAIFAPKGEFSPYASKPTPKFVIDDGTVKISWESQNEDYEFIIGKDQPVSKSESKYESWINIKLEDLTRNVELGSLPTFKVVESGWGNGCTSPILEVYYMKQKIGNDHTSDDLIYEHQIVYSCPEYDPVFPPNPVQRIWNESDFSGFPICEQQGRYLIVGDSGYERHALEEYYCGIENEN